MDKDHAGHQRRVHPGDSGQSEERAGKDHAVSRVGEEPGCEERHQQSGLHSHATDQHRMDDDDKSGDPPGRRSLPVDDEGDEQRGHEHPGHANHGAEDGRVQAGGPVQAR